MHNKIRTVIWDCDGVMWEPVENQPEILADELKIANAQELDAEFCYMFEQINIQFANKKVTINGVYNLIGRTMPILELYNRTPEEFMRKFGEISISTAILNKDVLVVMEYLRQRSYKNIVVSDWWKKWQIRKMKAFGIFEYIEAVYGCDNAYLKANPRSAKGIVIPGKEDECIIVGDTLEADICFAQHSGIQSIWFNRDHKKTNNTKFKPTYEFGSLLEIMQIL